MIKINKFRNFLKRKGKKEHVVDGLIKFCDNFELFLQNNRDTTFENTSEEDITEFMEFANANNLKIKQYLRSIALYFKFIGETELCKFAGQQREKKISKNRTIFKLRDFKGIDQDHIKLLEKFGIINVNQMIENGKTGDLRKRLSKKTGIPLEKILEFVKLSDLSRLGAVKSIRARLYFDSGLDTIIKISKYNPEEIIKITQDFIERNDFNGIAPLPKKAQNLVETAKKIKRIVEY